MPMRSSIRFRSITWVSRARLNVSSIVWGTHSVTTSAISSRGEPVYRIPRLMKIIGSITQGSHIFAGQEHAQAFINTHALLMRCIPVSGDLWESYIGVGGWTELSPKVSALKTLAEEGKPDAQIAVRSARALGKRVVETALIIREGLARNEGLLAAEPLYLPILKKIREKGSLRKLSEK